MDIFDEATIREEFHRDVSLRNARAQQDRLKPTGKCHWCDEPVDTARPFCDVDCRDDYEQDLKRQKIKGRPVNDEPDV